MNRYYTSKGLDLGLHLAVGGGQIGGVAVNGTQLTRTNDGHYKINLGPAEAWRPVDLHVVATVAQTNALVDYANLSASVFLRIPRDDTGKPTLHWPEPDKKRNLKVFRSTAKFGSDNTARVYIDIDVR